MELNQLLKAYKLDFNNIKNKYTRDYNQIYSEEKNWLCNLEDKTVLISDVNVKNKIDEVIKKLKDSNYNFQNNDIDLLTTFTSKINGIIRIANRINNFKQNTIIDNGQLDLSQLFNSLKNSILLKDVHLTLNQNLNSFLPHLFSIIKHCQDPVNYPIYYKYWKNISREIFNIDDGYDTFCEFYRLAPNQDRHLSFGTYLGAIGVNLAREINTYQYIKDEGDSNYNYIKKNLINIDRYFSLIEGYNRKPDYYIIGSKYGASANKDVFPFMFSKSVVSTGFAWDIDLIDYYGEESTTIVDFLKEQNEESKSINALKLFLSLKVGDKIAIKADGSPKGKVGFLSIIGIAEVIELNGKVYEFGDDNLGHIVNVKYIKAPVYKEFELGGYGRTIHRLSKKKHIELIFNSEYEIVNNNQTTINESMKNKNLIDVLIHKGQIVLQGPPGTGKTYTAKDIAEQILFSKVSEDKQQQKKLLESTEQFKLIQFHPAYTYEDFVRGIVVKTDISTTPEYRTVNKILGEFARKANESNLSGGTDDFDRAWYELVQNINDGKVAKIGSSDVEVDINTQGNIRFKSPVATYEKTYELYKYGKTDLKYETYNKIVLNYLKDTKGMYKMEDYVSPKSISSNKPYILIIDEINRANLPAVLGELIYALEYRGEKVESMYATLEEGNTLILPPNLYIIGTMNTSDRSVGHIDYAIRRRFAFIEILPKVLEEDYFELELFKQVSALFIQNFGEYFQDNTIALKLSEHLSEEFRPEDVWLGHSYFIKGEGDFSLRKKYEIIPILKEYLKDGILKQSAEPIINALLK